MQTLLQILIECLKRGEALAAVTIVSHEGSTPRTAGSKMLVDQQGALVAGSVGGGLLEAAALKAAPKVLKSGVPELMDFDLSGELAAEENLKFLLRLYSRISLNYFKNLMKKCAAVRICCSSLR